MSVRCTPVIKSSGVFEVKTPFVIDSTKTYTCIAVRTFGEMEQQGVNVKVDIYDAANIGAEYAADLAAGAVIVVLAPEVPTLPILRLPDTYISKIPNQNVVPYSNLVLSINIGAIADSVPLEFLITQLQNVVSDVIGIADCEVSTIKLPSAGVVTPDQHNATEAARLAAITLRTSDYVRVTELTQQLAACNTQRAGLEQILVDNDLIPTT